MKNNQDPVIIPSTAPVLIDFPDAEYVLRVLNDTPAAPKDVVPVLTRIQAARNGLVQAIQQGQPTIEQIVERLQLENVLLKQAVVGSDLQVDFMEVVKDLDVGKAESIFPKQTAIGLNTWLQTARTAVKVSDAFDPASRQ